MRSRFGQLTTDWSDYAFLRIPELEELLAGTGWRLTEHLADGPAYAVRLELSA